MDAFIGLGTNLGNRWANLRAGVDGLRRHGLKPAALSSVWESEPIDSESPLWFLNMAVRIETGEHPLTVLEALLAIERDTGRRRNGPNAPRTLDLDLLMQGELEWDDERLRLPHPRMWGRRFVLEPLREIAPGLRDPATGRSVAEEWHKVRGGAAVFKVGRLETC